jgi:GH43 family beta-xylosidase
MAYCAGIECFKFPECDWKIKGYLVNQGFSSGRKFGGGRVGVV